VSNEAKLGVIIARSTREYAKAGFFKIIKKEYSFGESIEVGIKRFSLEMDSYWSQFKLIFTPSTGAFKGVGGFKAIFDIFPNTWNWEAFWGRTALLSIMLGVLNLLPIPALDGGHVMFLIYEMISGRKPGDKFMEYAQTVGFFLLISLVLFANGNDIYKALFG
jgi:regulator of sigma E protease